MRHATAFLAALIAASSLANVGGCFYEGVEIGEGDASTDTDSDTNTASGTDTDTDTDTETDTDTDTISDTDTDTDDDTETGTGWECEPDTDSDTDSLVSWYPFSWVANDVGGACNDLTVVGAEKVDDRFGNEADAYEFDGVDDYLYMDYDADSGLFPTDDPFSIVAWFRTSAFSPLEQVIVGSHNAGCCDGYSMGVDGLLNSWRLRCMFKIHEDDTSAVSIDPVNDGLWHQVVCMWADDEVVLYIDSLLQDSTVAAGPVEYTSEVPFFVGWSEMESWEPDTYHFNGAIDDVRLYARALSEAEIDELFHFGGWDT